jgi:hypothetical protein
MHDQDDPQMPKDEGAHFGLTLLDWESAPSSFQSKIQVEPDCRFWIGDSTPSGSQSEIQTRLFSTFAFQGGRTTR